MFVLVILTVYIQYAQQFTIPHGIGTELKLCKWSLSYNWI